MNITFLCIVTQEFVVKPKSQKILYHRNVTFDCESHGVPTPSVEWEFQNKNGVTQSINSDGNKYVITKKNSLIVKKLEYTDEGDYYCISESPRLKRNVTANLNVYGRLTDVFVIFD